MIESEWTDSDAEAVAKCHIFSACGRDAVRGLWEHLGGKVCDFSGGEVIPPSLRSRRCGIVIAGSVKIYSGGDGDEAVLLNVVGRYELFDIAAIANPDEGEPLSVAKTAGKSRIVFVNVCDIGELIASYPVEAANCFRFLCGRVKFLNQKIHTLSRGTSEQKLADYLLNEFVEEDGRNTVRLKSCVELAVRLNLSRASLYRALGQLEQSGLIERSGKIIRLLDIEALQSV